MLPQPDSGIVRNSDLIIQGPASPGSRYQEGKGQPAQIADTRKSGASQPRIQIPESQGPASARSRYQEVKGQPSQVPVSGPDLGQIWTRSCSALAQAWLRSGADLAQIWPCIALPCLVLPCLALPCLCIAFALPLP